MQREKSSSAAEGGAPKAAPTPEVMESSREVRPEREGEEGTDAIADEWEEEGERGKGEQRW